MQCTTLRFLCTDGAINVQFTPDLDAGQYNELLGIVEIESTREALTARLKIAAEQWDARVMVDEI
jgi:hypothetical protein